MSEDSSGWAAILKLPGVRLAALAIAFWAVLLVPVELTDRVIPASDFAEFRRSWGPWLFVGAVALSFLAIAAGVIRIIAFIRDWRNTGDRKRSLVIEPSKTENWWHWSKQTDGSETSQISFKLHVLNRSARPVKIIDVELLKPRGLTSLQSHFMLPLSGSPYVDNRHPAIPNDGVWGVGSVIVKGKLAQVGRPTTVAVQIVDDAGIRYRVALSLRPHDLPLPRRPFSSLWRKGGWKLGAASPCEEAASFQWEKHPSDPVVSDQIDLILREEQRVYAARGRKQGKLGSLNTGVQSDPSSGWTKAGEIPALLWPKGEADPVGSQNVDRLVRLHGKLDEAGQSEMVEQLLHYLHRGSPFASVSYAIFLALHRAGKTLAGLDKAQGDLRGDKVLGYSNLIATLSAIVSKEHDELPLSLVEEIRKRFGDSDRVEFQLVEKLDRAKLLKLDQD